MFRTLNSSKLREAAKRRNQYVHGGWSDVSDKNFVRVKTQAKKNGVFNIYRRFDEVDMKADLEFIKAAHEALETFDTEIYEQLLAIQNKYAQP